HYRQWLKSQRPRLVHRQQNGLPLPRHRARRFNASARLQGRTLVHGARMIDTLDDVRTVLQFVDPTCTREDWVKVGDAIKGEFGDNGFDEWDRWSQGGDNYSPHAAKTTWRSLKGVVPMGWLAKLAKEKGWQPERRELTEAEKRERESEQLARRAQREQREKQEAALQQQWHERIAEYCRALQARIKPVGKSKYLGGKKIGAFGVGFVARATG